MTGPHMNTWTFFFFFVCSVRSAFKSDILLSHFLKYGELSNVHVAVTL